MTLDGPVSLVRGTKLARGRGVRVERAAGVCGPDVLARRRALSRGLAAVRRVDDTRAFGFAGRARRVGGRGRVGSMTVRRRAARQAVTRRLNVLCARRVRVK